MAEVIAVVGAVSAFASLIDLCFTLGNTLNTMREAYVDAPEAISMLAADVDSFCSILRQIANTLEQGLAKGLEYPVHVRANLRSIIQSCSILLLNLQKLLRKFEDFSDLVGRGNAIGILVTKMRFRWVWEEKKVVKIQQVLQNQKLTLNAQIVAMTAARSDQIMEVLGEALQRTERATTDSIKNIPSPTNDELTAAVPALSYSSHEDEQRELKVDPEGDPETKSEISSTTAHPCNTVVSPPQEPAAGEAKQGTSGIVGVNDRLGDTAAKVSGEVQETQGTVSPAGNVPGSLKSVNADTSTKISAQMAPELDAQIIRKSSSTPKIETTDSGKLIANQQPRSRSRSPASKRPRVPLVLSDDAIFAAADTGDNKILLQLLQGGVKIEARRPDGTTPLQVAVIRNHEEVVLTLLFFNADPNARGGYEICPLIAAINHGHTRLVKILLEAGADPNAMEVPSAAAKHSVQMLKLIVAKYPPFNYRVDINAFNVDEVHGINGETPLVAACNLGKIDVARFLLEELEADAGTVFNGSCVPQFRSALHASICRQDMALIDLVLSHIPDPNVINRHEPGFLQCAIGTGKTLIVQCLVEAGLNLEASFGIIQGTALQLACGIGSLEMVKYLLEHNANPNYANPNIRPPADIRSPLHAAVYRQSLPILQALLDVGADPSLQVGLLYGAAEKGDFDIMRVLLDDERLDINALASDWGAMGDVLGTALHGAVMRGQAEVVRYLLEEGADPNVRTSYLGTPLDQAVRKKQQACIDVLMGGGDAEDEDEEEE